ncbi:hypothetical protein BV25DRAFT_1592006 [Artomyces pyxidatus]|uniref:Uncharacterized protein n=1 Tax=Artomyces pyxidatus TaxID=48021 RepID=A0ACB8TAA2_9AGAM|nr:hypothetical protein BV25DRAFT_1592006 [Artomyces pyxidatus]
MATQMPSGSFRSSPYDLLDNDLMDSMLKNVPCDPFTGLVDPEMIMKYMDENPNCPEVQKILQQGEMAYIQHSTVDVSDFDFSSLAPTIRPGSRWRLTLGGSGQLCTACTRTPPRSCRYAEHSS